MCSKPNQQTTYSARGKNLHELLSDGDLELATAPIEPLPKYASVVDPPDNEERVLVFLHEGRTARSIPTLDTGARM